MSQWMFKVFVSDVVEEVLVGKIVRGVRQERMELNGKDFFNLFYSRDSVMIGKSGSRTERHRKRVFGGML